MFQSYEILIFALVLVGSGLGIILVNNSSWLLSVASEYERAKAADSYLQVFLWGNFAHLLSHSHLCA